jgi:hypothetical protein
MITKEEEKKFEEWFNGNNREPITDYSHETWGQFIHRGFLECGLIEREPTAKEKLNKYLSEHVIMDITNHTGCVSFEIRKLIDSAIKEAEEKT